MRIDDCGHRNCHARGWDNFRDAMADALATTVRRVAQGYDGVGVVYLCTQGNWHHATRGNAARFVAVIRGIGVGRDGDVDAAALTAAWMVALADMRGRA